MPKGPEATIERLLREHMQRRGGMFAKSVSPGKKGWPDRNPSHWVCGPFYMEIKAPKKFSTELQMEVAQEMADHGYRVYVSVNSVKMGMEIIDDEVDGVHPSQRRHKPVEASR